MENNKVKTLLCEKPPITSYPIIANMMSILWAHEEKTMPWIADRFIQLMWRGYFGNVSALRGTFYDNEVGYNKPIFLSCPFLYCSRYDRMIFHHHGMNLSDHVKKCVNDGYYLHLCLDHFYLAQTPSYRIKHRIHPTFIYGYDDASREVYMRDFVQGKYQDIKTSYDELDESYSNLPYSSTLDFEMMISAMKYRDTYYKVNINKIKRDYTDYLKLVDSRGIYREDPVYRQIDKDTVYGLRYYDVLNYMCVVKENDIRAAHVLVDHKVIQEKRIAYLSDNGLITNQEELIDLSQNLTKTATILRNMTIKIAMHKYEDIDEIIRLKNLCAQAKEEDEYFVKTLLDSLKC